MNNNQDELSASASKQAVLPDHIREVFSASTCLYTRDQINQSLDTMATEISFALSHTNPLLLCVVVGGIVPLGNLLPRLDFPLEVDYVHVTRYGQKIKGGGLKWIAHPTTSMQGRTILIVDDILDGGVTLAELVKYCQDNGAKAVYSAVLVDKQASRDPEGLDKADFCGLEVEDRFLFGFGMDYKGYLRNAPGIYMVSEICEAQG